MKGPIKFDEGKDRKGPISLAAVATVRGPEPAPTPSPAPGAPASEPAKAPEGRVVAVGDVDFASNQFLGFQGNQDFFLNTIAWLVEDADLISIRPKEPENQAHVPEPPGAAERRLARARDPAGALRDRRRRDLVGEAVAP